MRSDAEYHPDIYPSEILKEWFVVQTESWQRTTLEKLGLADALAVCLGEAPPLVGISRRPVAGVASTPQNPDSVYLTRAGKAVLARRRMS